MSNQSMYRPLFEADPQIAAAIDNETRRQHEGLDLRPDAAAAVR